MNAVKSAIRVNNLTVYAGQNHLLGPINFRLALGSTRVIMGETGAGKSLIIQAILGTLPDELDAQGDIYINDQRVDLLTQTERASLWGRSITTLPQEPWRALSPLMSASRQVEESFRHVAHLAPAEAKQATSRNLLSLGLAANESRLPQKLSGGMAQRLAFAAATAAQAPLLLADEPTKGLDTERQNKVIKLLKRLPENGGTLLTVTHDRTVAKELGGELMVLRDGQVIEQGRSQKILSTPQSSYSKQLFAADPATWRKKPQQAGHTEALLRASDVTIERGGRTLFAHFNLTIHNGEKVAICGPSGAGKTSLIDVLAGLIQPKFGAIQRSQNLCRLSIQKLYQDPPSAFPEHIPIQKTIVDVSQLHHCSWSRVVTLMDDLELHQSLLERHPNAVSGGELQRLAIVRALITDPKILLADEPTSRLDPITQKQTLDVIEKVSNEHSIAVVIVTHNPHIAQKWADRTVFL